MRSAFSQIYRAAVAMRIVVIIIVYRCFRGGPVDACYGDFADLAK